MGAPVDVATNAFDLQDLSIAYQGVTALQGICLRIEMGEKVVLIGPSGAGKSTLLRHLQELSSRDSALIHQDYALVPQLSTFHNIYAGRLDSHTSWQNLRTLLRPHPADVAAVQPILEALDLADKAHDRVQSLSGGQQQRVAAARALMGSPELLIADEPTSALDEGTRQQFLELLFLECKRAGTTLIFVSHDAHLGSLFERHVDFETLNRVDPHGPGC